MYLDWTFVRIQGLSIKILDRNLMNFSFISMREYCLDSFKDPLGASDQSDPYLIKFEWKFNSIM